MDCRGCYAIARFKVGDRVWTCAKLDEFATVVSVPTNNSYDVLILVDGETKPEPAINYGCFGGPKLMERNNEGS